MSATEAPSIVVAAHAGACYGVERALEMARDAARAASQPVHTLGPLIHNPIVVDDLAAQGVSVARDPAEAAAGTVIVRAHGVAPQVIEDARARGLHVVDATCPYVTRVHRAAEQLAAAGFQVLVVGESGHPEVQGIMGHAGPDALVISDETDIDALELGPRVGVVVQTTQTPARLAEVAGALAARVRELRVLNTICAATSERQEAARELAERSDLMIVVGGRTSGNTRRLSQICTAACPRTHHVESADEIDPAWLVGVARVGVTAGASTPASHIDAAVARIREVVGA